LSLLAMCSTTETNSQPFFYFSFSGGGSHFFLGLASDHNPTYGLPHTQDHKCVLSHLVYWLRWGTANFLPVLTSTSILLISTSWVAGIRDIGHCVQPLSYLFQKATRKTFECFYDKKSDTFEDIYIFIIIWLNVPI
jgi:hypothetical protein